MSEDLMSRTMSFFVGGAKSDAPVRKMNLRKKSKFESAKSFALRNEMAIYGGILVVLIAASGATALVARDSESAVAAKRAALAIEVGKIRPLMFRVDDLANKVVSGQSSSFDRLHEVNGQLNVIPQTLTELSGGVSSERINKLSSSLNQLMISIAGIQSGEKGLRDIDQSLAKINGDFGDMSVLLSDLSKTLPASSQVTAIKIDAAMQRIGRTIGSAYTAPSFTALMAEVGIGMEDVYTMLEELPEGDAKVMRVSEIIDGIGTNVEGMIAQSALISKAKYHVSDIDKLTQAAGDDADALLSSFSEESTSEWAFMSLAFAFASLAFIVLMVVRYTQISRKNANDATNQNKENQGAIMVLMDDLDEIGNGDLTKRARVTESITGSVADSINHTIDELGKLVKIISQVAGKIKGSTESAAGMTHDLSRVVDEQSNAIHSANGMVGMVVNSVKDIDASAAKSAEVAKRALSATDKGNAAVAASISGMDNIRDQIQDTSKRIKRLGESSQEIGGIISMISGITEQTRVLALNAALQAAQAGEAGRGFAIVAEEVQHLAERSADATMQISSLVRLIQNDTHDAVAAMERSTEGVVAGGRLTNEVGAELNEIRAVSDELAKIIESISVSTQVQSEMSRDMTKEMNSLLSVVEKSGAGVQIVENSVSEIAGLAEQLEGSIKRFKI